MGMFQLKSIVDVGTPLPDLSLPDQHGAPHRLRDYVGRPLVLFFYPKDDTPGWRIEVRGFRAAMDKLTAQGAQVMGASVDDVESHLRFAQKYKLEYPLLSDTDGTLCAEMGVLRKVGPVKIAARVTYLFDADGKVAHVFDKVSPLGHADEVIEVLATLPR